MTSDLETRALSRPWFYPFRLPSGATTPSYDGGWLDGIHHTRSAMLDAALRARFGNDRTPYRRTPRGRKRGGRP